MARPHRKRSAIQRAIEEGYRSGFEGRVAEQLEQEGVDFTFEEFKMKFTQPAKKRTYTPDFIIITRKGKKIVVETKGRFTVADRQKHLMVREDYPDVDLRFVFERSKTRISKTSKTTYGMWCEKHGFKYADKLVPQEWLDE